MYIYVLICNYTWKKLAASGGTRAHNILHTMQMLYQLRQFIWAGRAKVPLSDKQCNSNSALRSGLK